MNRYHSLMNCVKARKPNTLIEIGTWNGNHAVQMITNGEVKNYFGFDLFEDFTPEMAETEYCPKTPAKLENVRALLERIPNLTFRLIKGNTKETLQDFMVPEECKPVAFIFIDGGHSLETIESDWRHIQRHINPNTWIVFDDYYLDNNSLQYGCNKIIDNLDTYSWITRKLEPIDTFPKVGRIQMVLIQMLP